MTLIRREEEIQNNVFQIPNKSRVTRRNSRRCTGHSLDLGVERNDVENKFTFLKENGKPQPTRWWNDSRNLDTQYSKVFLRWLVGILRRKNNKETIHFIHCGSFEHSALKSNKSLSKSGQYQRSSWKLVWKFGLKPHEKPPKAMNDKILKGVQSQEEDSLVKSTKEWRARNWKQISRMWTELRDTGNRSPIYKIL